ncbi:helix-turn-helix transcriptional regulator [Frankia sp. R82]|uniref:helix-turn-helix domain-containing protein n=1 Tax=Frankia sp. R82 TaxID=2950553 RepID=UPI002044352E|nr:helix-turn-helix transcriptional regulator [Frankia sp. R82]MCM3883069.1 helix-turn-helix domain-containing protein [Frankia sp. R82]
MSSGAGPTALRRQLGGRLRELRAAAGLTAQATAERIDVSLSTISRIETADTRPKGPVLAALLALYQVDDDVRRELTELHRASGKPGWWHPYRGDLPPWFHRLLDLEDTAREIATYEPQLVPGLLQTEAYASAVLAADPDTTPESVNRRAEARLRRQKLLDGPNPPRLWVILEESVLLRPAGNPTVMAEQFRHLLAVAARPRVNLQVVPLSAGVHPALGAGFTMLTFNVDQPPLVYVEETEGANYLERPPIVRRFASRLDHLRAVALSPQASHDRIHQLGRENP